MAVLVNYNGMIAPLLTKLKDEPRWVFDLHGIGLRPVRKWDSPNNGYLVFVTYI